MRVAALAFALAAMGCGGPAPRDDPHWRGTINGPLSGEFAISDQASGGEKLADLGREGLRVLIAPSFGRYGYYLSLRRFPVGCLPRDRRLHDGSDAGRACGPTRVDVRRIDQFDKTIATARFFLPPEESDDLFEELDLRLSKWNGDNYGGTDGTGVELERVRDGRITSMSSNGVPAELDNPASQLRGDLLRVLLAYGPSGFAPRSGSWHVRPPAETEDLCNNNALVAPLDQGFGVGDSDCDAAKRWPG